MTVNELKQMADFHGITWDGKEFVVDSCLNDEIAAMAWLESLSYMNRQRLRILVAG